MDRIMASWCESETKLISAVMGSSQTLWQENVSPKPHPSHWYSLESSQPSAMVGLCQCHTPLIGKLLVSWVQWWAYIHATPLTLVLIGELSEPSAMAGLCQCHTPHIGTHWRALWAEFNGGPMSMPHPHIGTHWRALGELSPMVGLCPYHTPHIGTHWRALGEPSAMAGL